MRAYVFDGTTAQLTEVPDPVAGAGDVVLKVTAAGLCHSDLDVMARPASSIQFPLPIILGHEACGTVVEVGAEVDAIRVGDQFAVHGPRGCGRCGICAAGQENYCRHARKLGIWPIGLGSDGALAEYIRIEDPASLVPLRGLSPVLAAPLTDAGLTSFHAIRSSAKLSGPDSVAVVIGVGGLGHLAVQMLGTLTSGRVIAVDVNERRLALARTLGAHTAVTPTDAPGAVAELSSGLGADLVLDFVGSRSAVDLALSSLAQHGELVLIGLGDGVAGVGMRTVPFGTTVRTTYWGSRAELVDVVDLALHGAVDVRTVPIPLSEVKRGYTLLADGGFDGRIVVVPD